MKLRVFFTHLRNANPHIHDFRFKTIIFLDSDLELFDFFVLAHVPTVGNALRPISRPYAIEKYSREWHVNGEIAIPASLMRPDRVRS